MTTGAESSQPGSSPILVIESSRGWARLGIREIWRYRELLYFLTWRNILIRYKQAVLGVLWAVLNPFITMVVFTVVFNRLLGVGSGSYGVPYAVFTFTGAAKSAVPDTVEVAVAEVVESAEGSEATGTE